MPVHIGVQQLKRIAFLTVQPPFLRWSKEADISIDELCLRNKDWVEMVCLPGIQDVDAIASKFFVAKGKSRNIQFHAGRAAEVFLELAHEKYTQIVTRLEDLEDGDVDTPVRWNFPSFASGYLMINCIALSVLLLYQ